MDDNQLSDAAYEAHAYNELTGIVRDTVLVVGGFVLLSAVIIVGWWCFG